MKIPFSRVHVHGGVLLAALGGKIHSFSLADGKHISTWQHPDLLSKASSTSETASEARGASLDVPAAGSAADQDGPPAKRPRLDNGEYLQAPSAGVDAATADDAAQGDDGVQHDAHGEDQNEGAGNVKGNKNKKASPKGSVHQFARVPERPVITQLTSTADGSHVLAVSGHDKVIWVFDHDNQGGLTQVSSRTMPKRPCVVIIAADSQIISADKFGDVYSLPLAPAPQSPSSMALRSATPNLVAKPLVPAASSLTVHSKRNLEALRNQKRQLELRSQMAADEAKQGPDFELTLLLGHVSMLTSLVIGEGDGRKYIVTSDRDEHIRVSRYMPQAHVIEGFCLGHKEFVSELVIPPSRDELLISGGGDDELFVWDWKAGTLLYKANIVSLVQRIAPETAKVAVSSLHSLLYPTKTGNLTFILAICEGIQAIFSWQLTADNTLNHPGAIHLSAAPLHLAVCAPGDAPPKLIVAMDPGQTSVHSLHALALTERSGRLSVDTETYFRDEGLQTDDLDASESEIRRLLYTVESLRKQPAAAEDDGPAADAGTDMASDEIPAADDEQHLPAGP